MSLIVVAVAVGAGGEGAGVAHLVGRGALGDLAHPVGVHRGTLRQSDSPAVGTLVQPEYSSPGYFTLGWLPA